jgi:hypothetical protein
MEQPPVNTDNQLKEYLFRQLLTLENRSLQLGNLEILTALPNKPSIGKVYYFANAILPSITYEGAWVYTSYGWTSLSSMSSTPYGAFQDTVSHTVTANTANAMTFNTTDYSSNVSMVSGSRITVAYSGLYNLQFSTQFQNDDSAPQDVSIWLKINGVDVAGSTGLLGLPARKSAGDPYHDIKGWNFFVRLTAGQYVEIWWSTTHAAVTIQAYAAGTSPTRPSTASNVATMTYVAQ